MTQFKIHCLDKYHLKNQNLLAGLIPKKYFTDNLKEAVDIDQPLFIYTSGLQPQIDLELFHYRKNKKTFLLIDYAYESGISNSVYDSLVQKIVELGVNKKQILVVLNCSAEQTFQKNTNIIFCDLFAISSVARYKHNSKLANVYPLAELPNKVNLLLGKLDKKPRLSLIETFRNTVPESKSLVSLLGFPSAPIPDDFKSYIENNQGPLDTAEVLDTNEGKSSQGWGSSAVYEKSSVSLVCETHQHNDLPFLTEKTFRPIINAHPFVILAGCKPLEHLKELGFKTFDRVIDESYENLSCNNLGKLEQVVTQSIKLLENKEHVQEIVDHNKNHLLTHGERQMALLLEALTKRSIEDNG